MVSHTYRIHNIRFYNLEPKSVTCLCYELKAKKLALARNDNSIEIWNVANTPFIENIIAGHAENSVESILWIGLRLFLTGLHGAVVEYDLTTLGIKQEVMVVGGAAWCMDVNHEKTCLAVGTEDGFINTFAVHEDKLIYEKLFDKQKGRILCLKWSNTGELIYTGSTNTIRVWSVASGHAIHKMTTSKNDIRKDTIVWCLAVTNDNIIISGDSQGVLSFWDPHMGVLIESHESHTADILAITLSHDMNIVYCTGVDPVVRSFCKVILKSNGKPQWVKGIERRLHAHDVRTLVEANGKLYSAGVDGYLAVSSYPPKNLVKYPPLLKPPCAIICRKSRCILLQYTKYLELWRLGSATEDSPVSVGSSMLHRLEEEPIKLLRLGAKGNESIISCAINKNSKIIVYSTDSHVRVFNFDVVEGDAQLSRNDTDLSVLNRVQKMLFSPNGKLFVTINNDGNENTITLFGVNKKCLRNVGSFQTTKESISNIGLVCFSPDSKYLVCADRESRIAIYFIAEGVATESLKAWQLPKYSCPPTAMAVQKNTLNLVVVYSDHKIVEYNIPRKQYTEFSNNLQSHLPKQWLARPFPITNIIFDPHNENIIMQDDTSVYVINKNNESLEKEAKIPKRENGENTEDSNSLSSLHAQHTFRVAKKYKHLVYLNWLNDEELVAVEVNPISLSEKLPPTLKQKFFGM